MMERQEPHPKSLQKSLTENNESCKGFLAYIPARYVLAFLGCMGITITYMLRTDMNVTIVAMVHPSLTPRHPLQNTTIVCAEILLEKTSNSSSYPQSSSNSKGEFFWNSNMQGMVLGSFFVSYLISQIPGGIMAEKYGGKNVITVGIMVAIIVQLLVPVAARWNVWAVIVIRFIQGLFEGCIFPAMNHLISRWSPKMERSRMAAFIYMGGSIGIVASFTLSGVLSSSNFLGGWPSVFYVFGGIGCIWQILWNLLVFENPDEHPRITKEELSLIHIGQDERKPSPATPWKEILTSFPVWAVVIAHFGHNWILNIVVTELPTYMANILHFDLKKNGVLSSLPHIAKVSVSLLIGYLADYMRKKNCLHITSIRKIMNSIAFFGCGLCILSVVFVGCESQTIVMLFILAMLFNGFVSAGFFVTHVDMSPEYAGVLMGLTNCIGNLPGFIVPNFVGKVIEDGQTLHNWSIVFITTSAIIFLAGMFFNIFGSAELQAWNSAPSEAQANKEEKFSKLPEDFIDQRV